MATKVTITLTEEFDEPTEISERMEIDYELDKDEEGMVLIRSNILGIGRTILELFKCGALHSMTQGFIPASLAEREANALHMLSALEEEGVDQWEGYANALRRAELK